MRTGRGSTPEIEAERRRKISDSHIGLKHSEESKRRISENKKGKPLSEEHKQLLSQIRKGRPKSEEHKQKIAESLKGHPVPEEVRRKLSEKLSGEGNASFGVTPSAETLLKRSASLKGIVFSECRKEKMSIAARKRIGPKNHQWKGGVSFEPYCPLFNSDLRRRVRAFFKNRCVLCGKEEPALCVHHVDYDKHVCCNGNPPLFVALCRSCHTRTNNDRKRWALFFNEFIYLQYGGKCYYTKQEYENLQNL